MVNKAQLFLVLLICSIISGCAHGPVVSPDLRAKADLSLTYGEVLKNPDVYKGRVVLWGGKILQIIPEEEVTVIEISQMPLNKREKPEGAAVPEEKFFIVVKQDMDFSQFETGGKITVAGEIQGTVQEEKLKFLDGMTQPYPVIISKEIHLWKKHGYPYSSAPDYTATWEYIHYRGILRY